MKNLKKGDVDLLAIIIICVIAGVLAIYIGKKQTSSVSQVQETIGSEAFLLS